MTAILICRLNRNVNFVLLFCSWLRDKHNKGLIESLFWSRAEYRIHLAVHNPIFIPSRLPTEGSTASLSPEIQFTANEAQAKMLAIEKCDIVVMNPLFGSGLPYNPKVGEHSVCCVCV